jgi:hypothetical protein
MFFLREISNLVDFAYRLCYYSGTYDNKEKYREEDA